MAIAQKFLAGRYNKPGFEIFDYNIYSVCGDGCLMEGVASEAASLAGHLGLDNLCWIYDNNHITIEGNTKLAFTEDVATRFMAYGWNVMRVGDANDIDRIEKALEIFRNTKGRPTFIVLDSHIGYGSPNKQDSAAAHGEPLGDDEIRLTKRSYGWPENEKFLVPDGVYGHFAAGVGGRGAGLRSEWTKLVAAYRSQYPELAKEIELIQRRQLPEGWDRNLPVFAPDAKGIAGGRLQAKSSTSWRKTSVVPRRFCGSRPVEQDHPDIQRGRRFRSRESDRKESPLRYSRTCDGGHHQRAVALESPSLRRNLLHLQRLCAARHPARGADGTTAIFVFTHDAMGDGEDGPTHQPIEQMASLRAIPGLIRCGLAMQTRSSRLIAMSCSSATNPP
jgi:transketolase